jgi:two-component system, NtrC family, sensor histidine kinase HydH
MRLTLLSFRYAFEIAVVCLALCVVAVPHYVSALPPLLPYQEFLPVYYLFSVGMFIVALWFGLKGGTLKVALIRNAKRDAIQMAAICVALCIITIVHYEATQREILWHELFQRAYYLPIIVAALWYGSRGGLVAAGLAAILYIPHIVMAWHGFMNYQFNQYFEVVLFFVFGGLTGILADQQRRQKEKLQETAQRLSQANAELQASFESLRRAERLTALGRLSAGLAHEIRSPLSAIQGALEIATRPELDAERREEFTALVKKEFARLNEMLNHFLEFARPRPPQLRPTSLQTMMEGVCGLVSEFTSGHNISTRCTSRRLTASVSLDSDQIKEVLLNLVINASEALQPGGTIEVWAEEIEDVVVISVKDDGSGVDEENLQQIFDPFFTTKPTGTGLGLSIAYRIMEQHGGKIEAKRNLDHGMTFSLIFPRQQPAETGNIS